MSADDERKHHEANLEWPISSREFAHRLKQVGTRYSLINTQDPLSGSAVGNYSISFNQEILKNTPAKIEHLQSTPKVGNRMFVGLHFGKPNSFDIKDRGWQRWWATSEIQSIKDNPIGDGSLILTTESGSTYFWFDNEGD